MRLRRARSEDIDPIAWLFRRSFGTLTFLPSLHTPEEDLAFFAGVLAEQEVWVAEAEGLIVGFAALGEAMLNHLYVEPSERGRGIGTTLLDKAKGRRPNGFRFWTFQRNHDACRFYERRGCRAVEYTDGSGNEEREPDVLYEWRPA